MYDGWDAMLREAPAALVKASALRMIVEEAIAESQLLQAERFAPRLGRTRAVELLRDFGRAVDRTRFASTRDLRFRAWLAGALRMPSLPQAARLFQ